MKSCGAASPIASHYGPAADGPHPELYSLEQLA
jgi:hypothetical protein